MPFTSADREMLVALYAPLCRFAGVVGPIGDEPEDLVQDALLGAMARRPLSEYRNLGAYLRASIVSLSVDRSRRRGRQRLALGRLGPSAVAMPDTYPSDVSELLDLAPEVRAVVFLVDVEGASFAEAAEIVGCSAAAARARASRERRQLRRLLGGES